jgi:hypothetical protein
MGIFDGAMDAAQATGRRIGEVVDDARERIGDRVDAVKAETEVKRARGDVRKAQASRDITESKNEYKEDLRD